VATSDLVVASNRLPVSVAFAAGSLSLEPSAGGLVAALGGIATPFSWIGWPGGVVPAEAEQELRERLAADRLFPILLDPEEETEFYGRLCNDTLWPLFHGFAGRQRFTPLAWRHYVAVNERFAVEIAARSAERATVWIHDFHLLLVPAALRRLRPDLSIGFFLHVPFPAPEVFRLLPARQARGELLLGLLGADAIGFHTVGYVHHFRTSCLDVLGLASQPAAIALGGRTVELGADPIGIDSARFRRALALPAAAERAQVLEQRCRGRRLVLGVDRLDYTKGVPQKLRAFERFLEREPARAATTLLLQVLSRPESSSLSTAAPT
jgi:trehalose 6-phosphate synthase/phosphatase